MKRLISLIAACSCSVLLASPVVAAGDAEAGKSKSVACGGCHGMDGNSATPDFPKLAGQNARYLAKQIWDIKGDDKGVRRPVPVMAAMVANLSAQDVEDIAAYYASQTATPGAADPELVEAGAELYRAGDLENGIAACTACHSPTGMGNPPAGFPRLSGQHARYIETQLKAFRDGSRSNDGDAMMMRGVAKRLTNEQISALASYASGLH